MSELENVLCVTNRHLARPVWGEQTEEGALLARIACVCVARPRAVVLREKDLSVVDYARLARKVLAVCRAADVPCLLHSFVEVACELGVRNIQLPLPRLRTLTAAQKKQFSVLGASCHSLADAQEAERLGATFVTLGHIYATDCKRGLPPRGLDLLREVTAGVRLPVYAIGGITRARIPEVLSAGATGACVMSGLMQGAF